jgi:PHD/YefM family antitoxin component YafN of YafNO toxin-antitoxin module
VIAMIAIKTVDITQDFKRVAEKVLSGETVLISRPRNENLVVISEREYNKLANDTSLLQQSRISAMDSIRAIQQSVINSGADEMTMDDICEAIKEINQEKRGL